MKQIFYIALLFVSYNTSVQTSAYSQSRQYNDYIQPVNTQLVREVLAKKQTNYNRNAEKVQSKIDNIEKLLQKLYKTKGSYFTKNQKEYIDSIYKYVNNLSKESIADNYGIIQILRTLNYIVTFKAKPNSGEMILTKIHKQYQNFPFRSKFNPVIKS